MRLSKKNYWIRLNDDTPTHSKTLILLYLGGLIVALSIIALTINFFIYKYPGNNYFPENTIIIPITLILIKIGLRLCLEKNSVYQKASNELFYFFLVMSVIAFATNAIQLTPFSPIDTKILDIEYKMNIKLTTLMEWTNTLPAFKDLLIRIYDTLPLQMSIIPLFIISTGRYALIKDYYFLLLITALIGFTFYYFFPTIAPASTIHSPLFSPGQLATGLKFSEIHHHLTPTTLDGGLIAFPSFHVIWAILCVYLVKDWPFLFILLTIINSLLIASCVLLGWHYPTDVFGGIILVLFAFFILNQYKLLNQFSKNNLCTGQKTTKLKRAQC